MNTGNLFTQSFHCVPNIMESRPLGCRDKGDTAQARPQKQGTSSEDRATVGGELGRLVSFRSEHMGVVAGYGVCNAAAVAVSLRLEDASSSPWGGKSNNSHTGHPLPIVLQNSLFRHIGTPLGHQQVLYSICSLHPHLPFTP